MIADKARQVSMLTSRFGLAMIVRAGMLVLAGLLAVLLADAHVLQREPEGRPAEPASLRSCPVRAPQLGHHEPSGELSRING